MKRRFNWLDGACILLVGALILGGVWYFAQKEEPKKKVDEIPYTITLRCSQTTDDPTNYVREGETLYFLGREKEMGTILSVETVDRQVEEFDSNKGEYVLLTDPVEQLVEIKVEVMGKRKKATFSVNEINMHVGQTFYPQTDHARMIATVWSIEEVAE